MLPAGAMHTYREQRTSLLFTSHIEIYLSMYRNSSLFSLIHFAALAFPLADASFCCVQGFATMSGEGQSWMPQTVGPSFSSSRVLRFSELGQGEQEAFVRFFAENKVQASAFLSGLRGLRRATREVARSTREEE